MSLADGNPSTKTESVITTPLVVVSAVFPVLAAVSIYLRLMAKRRIRQPYHADDWWVIAAWFMTFPMSVLFWVFAAKSGVDYYTIDSLQGTYDSLQVGSSFALDVVVLCFPLPIVFSMLLSTRKKFMVFFMFWLGAL
ncbi:hypothetical protein INS49_013352 [Diaporthe citri]|uniref:uncharacterized protein n=1 Tax=Diaporthe citri TaxID=83186 RepID=UPI001C8158D9|nr:uncharacterized protein INS49_013352 [Diaporthe citri]KAG6357475.1 hypothetical protein INS49_013352 [Diaporthe citri]